MTVVAMLGDASVVASTRESFGAGVAGVGVGVGRMAWQRMAGVVEGAS